MVMSEMFMKIMAVHNSWHLVFVSVYFDINMDKIWLSPGSDSFL